MHQCGVVLGAEDATVSTIGNGADHAAVEGVAWIQYNDNVDLTASAFALFFNVTQPIVLALIIRLACRSQYGMRSLQILCTPHCY